MLQCRFIILRGRNTATLMKGFWVVIIACSLCFVVVAAGKKKGLHYVKPISPPRSDSTTHLFQETEQSCSEGRKECNDCDEPCSWAVPDTKGAGLHYSLTDICNSQFSDTLPNPRGATLTVSVCGRVKCGEGTARGCISVPGVQPTVAGRTLSLQTLVTGSPSYGFQLLLDEGERCEVTGKSRRTLVTFPCDPTHPVTDGLEPLEAYEGKGKDVCHYYMVFPRSKLGCPIHHVSITDSAHIINIESVGGCMDSDPERSTTNCPSTGGKSLTIRATGISSLCPDHTPDHAQLVIDSAKCTDHIRDNYCVTVGDSECTHVTVEEYFTLTCTLGKGRGSDLSVRIIKRDPGSKSCDCRSCDSSTMSCDPGRKSCDVVAELIKAVSYKRTVNFRDIFDRFVEYGVGGLKKEVDELYRRAFASRGLSGELLSQLGISHIKGILLHGPPGTGKTLLARTIAKALGSTQVQLINGPEIISKYLGESERNLRHYFDNAHNAYLLHGDASDLYVIIIDEIDAICKPRGKSDHSAAGAAYDSLVNQLLTLMDGLSEVSNVLVIGMTNRKELLDSALLRPGRFEIQIEMNLPDENGRLEIFEIHTRAMRRSGLLGEDVSLTELAANTSGYSGAEIAGCVRGASSYALERQPRQQSVDEGVWQGAESVTSLVITAEDFRRALESITPAYTNTESVISRQFLPRQFINLGTEHEHVITSLLATARTLSHTPYTRLQSVLLYGPKGTGKTSMAAQIAVVGQFKIVKIITAASLIGLPDIHKVDIIKQAFIEATKADKSLIILDNLHRLLEYVPLGGTQVSLSHSMMHTITTMLSTPPPITSSVLVIGTMTADSLSELIHSPSGLGLHGLFSWHYLVPPLDSTAVTEFLNVNQILRADGRGRLTPPVQLGSVPVKQLIQAIECASQEGLPLQLSHVSVDQKRFNECIQTITSVKRQDPMKTYSE